MSTDNVSSESAFDSVKTQTALGASEILFDKTALTIIQNQNRNQLDLQPAARPQFVTEIAQAEPNDKQQPSPTQDAAADTIAIPSLLLNQEAREDTVKRYPKDSTTAKIFEKVSPAVVKIVATRPGQIPGTTDTSYGTGFFVDPDGTIATNDHTFNGFNEITITTADKKVYKASILAEDKVNDVALLKIQPKGDEQFPVLEIEPDSNSIAMKQPVLIFGHAKGWDKTYLSEGVVVGATTVSKVDPTPDPPEENPNKRVVAVNAHGEDGGSGGPVVNEKGKVTGLAELASDSERGQHVFVTLVEPLNALMEKTLGKKQK